MRASFLDLRLAGELLCGGAHDILTRRTRFGASQLGDMRTTAGEERPFAGCRKARHVPGRNAVNANVNYSSLLIRYFGSLACIKTAPKIITHRQVIEPNM